VRPLPDPQLQACRLQCILFVPYVVCAQRSQKVAQPPLQHPKTLLTTRTQTVAGACFYHFSRLNVSVHSARKKRKVEPEEKSGTGASAAAGASSAAASGAGSGSGFGLASDRATEARSLSLASLPKSNQAALDSLARELASAKQHAHEELTAVKRQMQAMLTAMHQQISQLQASHQVLQSAVYAVQAQQQQTMLASAFSSSAPMLPPLSSQFGFATPSLLGQQQTLPAALLPTLPAAAFASASAAQTAQ
jgi:hypothetical protein